MTMVAENQGKLNCFPPQFQHMSSEAKTVPGKKLKIIFKRLLDASEDNSSESTMINILDYGQADRDTTVGSKSFERNVPLKESMPAKSKKRRLEISGPGEKKQKLESNLKLQLRKVLKELMSHRAGPIFSEPVDPVKLKIPDYFSIITKPMDLGTILRKLDGNMYSDAKEFAADVRLTFSNAMLYNPLWHEVHKWAMTLDAKFNTRWKILEAKLENGKMKDGGTRSEDYEEYKVHDAKQSGPNNHQHMKPDDLMKAALPVRLGTCGLMSQEEKQKVRLDTVQLLCKQRRKLLSVFQKFGLVDLNKERLDSYIASIDDETLFKLRREVKVLLSAKAGKVEPRKQALNGCSSFSKAGDKGGHRRSISSTESGCSSCVGQKGHRLIDVATQRSASDLSSERSAEQNRCGDSRLDHEIKYPSDSLTSPCGLGSDGSGGVISEADSFRLSTPASVEGLSFNVPMSPKKALRAAMLKKRFADTIFKATHQEYSDHNEKSDRLKLQQERERLEQEHREEKAKIEAQIKAAEEASRRELHNLKMQRENERKAARIVFEMVEKSVEVDDNTGILTNLKMIGCDYLYYPRDHGNRLEQLGLYRKDEYLEEEEDMAILNVEEGEILS